MYKKTDIRKHSEYKKTVYFFKTDIRKNGETKKGGSKKNVKRKNYEGSIPPAIVRLQFTGP